MGPAILAETLAALRDRAIANESDQRTSVRRRERRAILERWTALAPRDAFAWANGLADPFSRTEALSTVFLRWGEIDPQSAAVQVLQVEGQSARTHVLRSVLEGWVQSAPDDAIAWAGSLEDRKLGRTATALAQLDCAQLWPEKIFALDSTAQHPVGLNEATRELTRRDPAAALAAIETLPDPRHRELALRTYAEELARTDPEAAGHFALANTDEEVRRGLLSAVVKSYTRSDPVAALDWIRRNVPESPLRPDLIRQATMALAEQDPQAASLVFPEIEGEQSAYMARTIATTWVQTDPGAAVAWAAQLPVGDARNQAVTGLLEELFRADPATALVTAQRTFDEATLLQAMPQLAWVASQYDPHEAQGLFGLLPCGQAHDLFIGTLATNWAEQSKGAAALGILEQLSDQAFRGEAVSFVFEKWSFQNPAAAAKHAYVLPAGEQRDQIVLNSIREWAKVDPEASIGWASEQPAGTIAPHALTASISYLASHDPARAAQWVHAFPTEEARQSATEIVARQWVRRDPAGAAQWLATTALPAELQAQLLGGGGAEP